MKQIIRILIMVLVCASCGRNHPIRTLSRIEAILDSDPAAAQASLDSIDATTLKGRHLARYAMLKTQADYKCYVDIPSDSLIRIATDWYGTRHKDWHAAMSWYSLGCVSDLNGNELDALDAYLKAMSLFSDTTIRYYALCQQNVGVLYEKRHMNQDALRLFNSCIANSVRLDDKATELFARYHSGLCLMYLEEYSMSDSIFNSILADNMSTAEQKNNILLQKAKIKLYNDQNYEDVIQLINQHLSVLSKPELSGAALSVKAAAFYSMNELDSAYNCYKLAMEYRNELYTLCNNADRLVRLSVLKGIDSDAIYYMDVFKTAMDSISILRHTSEIEEIRQGYKTELAQQAMKSRIQRITLICVSLVIIFILVTVLVYIARMNAQKEKLRHSSIEILEAKVREQQDNDPEARQTLLKLYRQRISYCSRRFQTTPEYKTLLSLKANAVSGNTSYAEMTGISTALKNSYIEVIQDIQTEMPIAKEQDYITIILMSIGCENDLIAAVIGGITRDAIRKRKHKIMENMAPDYLDMINSAALNAR
ncbi:MAG: hypothetical protein MJZ06_07820 [Bacteroidaceae bacterium]|nr:hypothetical protein [Bacteroidaceae bacterium]